MKASTLTFSNVLTPPGTGAIAVIRVVGPRAERCVDSMFRSRSGTTLSCSPANRLRYGELLDRDEVLDEVVVCVIARKPQTVVELCLHGGIRVVERVLSAFERSGVKVADAPSGSSSLFLRSGDSSDDRFSLWPNANAVEGDADRALLMAKTKRTVRFLANQRCLLPTRLIELIHSAEAEGEGVHSGVRDLLSGYDGARRLIEGVTIALVGPPNAGKSALFNRLVGRDAVVVSPIEGTTRDWVSASLELEGVPVTLLDTAGDRAAFDEAERAAIEVGRSLWREADLVLVVGDVTRWREMGYADAVMQMCRARRSGGRRVSPCLLVLNKGDLVRPGGSPEAEAESAESRTKPSLVSALTGSGISVLMRSIARILGFYRFTEDKACLFAARQKDSASRALALPITDSDGLRKRLTQLLVG